MFAQDKRPNVILFFFRQFLDKTRPSGPTKMTTTWHCIMYSTVFNIEARIILYAFIIYRWRPALSPAARRIIIIYELSARKECVV